MSAKYTPGREVITKLPPTVVLEISVELAAALMEIYNGVCGAPDTSLRGEWQQLANDVRLAIQGVPHKKIGLNSGHRNIHFSDLAD